MRRIALWVFVAFMCACDNSGAGTPADADAESFAYAACAEPGERVLFPSPAWIGAGGLVVPDEADAAGAVMRSMKRTRAWMDDVPLLDGFGRTSGWIVPLSAAASAVDPAKVRFYVQRGSTRLPVAEAPRAVLLDGGTYLALQPAAALPRPAAGDRFGLVIERGAVTGADPLPACAAGAAHPDYVNAGRAAVAAGINAVWAYEAPASMEPGALAAIDARLIAAPALTVKSIQAKAPAEFGDAAPDAETAAALADRAFAGVLSLPAYQNQQGHFSRAAAGAPTPQGVTEPAFVLALPRGGTAPYPVVLFQHGGGRKPADLFRIARPWAAAGFALVGIDLVGHGNRAAKGAGNDLSMVDTADGVRTRDNFRQVAADHSAVLTGLAKLSEAVAGAGGPPGALDSARVYILGHSMGSMTSHLTLGSRADLAGAVLLGGGGPFRRLVGEGVFQLLFTELFGGRPAVETELALSVLQTIVDAGDPLGAGAGAPGQAADVLVFEAVADPVAVNGATETQAAALGAALALPKHHDVPGFIEAAEPVADNTEPQPGRRRTRLLKQVVYRDAEPEPALHMDVFLDIRIHEAAARCFKARLDGGTCSFRFDP